jgi:hypothetical protein
MPQDDIAAQWRSFDSNRRDELLKKMTPAQKSELRQKLEASQTVTPTTGATIAPLPKWYTPAGIERTVKGARNSIINQLPNLGGLGGALAAGGPADPVGAVAGAAAGGALGEDARQAIFHHLYPNQKDMTATEAAKNIAEQAGLQAGAEIVPRVFGKLVRPASAVEKLSFAGNLGPGEDVAPALSEIQKTEAMPGNKVKTVGDYLNVLKQTKNRIGTEVSAALKYPVKVAGKDTPLAAVEADTTPIADALESLMGKHPSEAETNPKKLSMFKTRALMYQSKPHTYGWLFDRRQVLNEEINRFYSLATPGEKVTYLFQHPEFEADKAEADAIRDLTYPAMDKAAGKPDGYFRDLQHKYGAIIGVEDATTKNVEKLEAKGRVQRGAPFGERINASTYTSGEGRPGFSLHRVHSLFLRPNPAGSLDSAAKSAFGHSGWSNTGKVLSSTPSIETLSLPLRYLTTPEQDEPDSPSLPDAHPVMSTMPR